jgi:hypothetical protein
MVANPADVEEGRPPGLRPFRIIPGGASAIPEEAYAAGILALSIVGLWAIRRNLGPEGRTMASGTAAIVFLFYYLIVTAIVRVAASNLAERGDTALARGFAFFA